MNRVSNVFRFSLAVLMSCLPGYFPLAVAMADEATIAAGRMIVANGVSPEQPGCSSCHLQDGAGQPDVGIPRLAGLTSSYMASQLGYFASGERQNTAMAPYAKALTPAQWQEVADYFANLPVPMQADQLPAVLAIWDRGRTLFLDGDAGTGLLACSQCHGQTALGVGDFSPRLAGQSAAYLMEELGQWHSGDRRDPKGEFMRAEAGNLTQADIQAVATFVASLNTKETSKP